MATSGIGILRQLRICLKRLKTEPFEDIGWDSSVTKMDRMFYNQDIGDWNVSNVTSMTRMFNVANVFNQDIGNWNTSSVINMQWLFTEAGAFNRDISNWDTSTPI